MSTAKSMANSYLNGKRAGRAALTPVGQHRFKSSASNLSSSSPSKSASGSSVRAKSTSMTNLNQQESLSQQVGLNSSGKPATIQSRNALDSIHNGMNARYAQVQSKVYQQNIKPNAASKIPATNSQKPRAATLSRPPPAQLAASSTKTSASGQAAALQARLGQLEEQLRLVEVEAEARRQELERERQDRQEQVAKLKGELEEKAAELERQSEEQHRKLLEAYELADQNRRSADQALAESRQRDEEARKRRLELEQQLQELREFVQMKEEMAGKMGELREQLRDERERYEQQLANLRQVFENEKISSKDENSNYFSRQKPLADSTDSINESVRVAQMSPVGCRKCRAGRSQLHRSEQDMYGSRVSTRVQESVSSAWRASKQFASSIITGGVSLSACRQLKRPKEKKSKTEAVSQPLAPARSPRPERRGQELAVGPQDDEHTSVVRVELAGASQRPPELSADNEKIHVDPESNKLTIVTKFAAGASNSSSATTSPREQQRSPESAGSSSSSSSSGRGTSDDANSAVSSLEVANAAAVAVKDPDSREPKEKSKTSSPVERRHRRRSSLFKASKVFGTGSQTSLNKLRSFFSSSASADISKDIGDEDKQQQQQSMEHLESSRRRCLELARLATAAAASQQPQEVGQGGLAAAEQN